VNEAVDVGSWRVVDGAMGKRVRNTGVGGPASRNGPGQLRKGRGRGWPEAAEKKEREPVGGDPVVDVATSPVK